MTRRLELSLPTRQSSLACPIPFAVITISTNARLRLLKRIRRAFKDTMNVPTCLERILVCVMLWMVAFQSVSAQLSAFACKRELRCSSDAFASHCYRPYKPERDTSRGDMHGCFSKWSRFFSAGNYDRRREHLSDGDRRRMLSAMSENPRQERRDD